MSDLSAHSPSASNGIGFAINHMVTPGKAIDDFFQLARELGLSAVEIRNDLKGVAIADGTPPDAVKDSARKHELRLLSINALQRFNDWNAQRAIEAVELARYAHLCGAEAVVLCPVNSLDDHRSESQRYDDLCVALRALLPILKDHGVRGLVEPLGFTECSLRRKRAAVDAIDAMRGQSVFGLVHDTFHHYLSGESEIFPARTGLVHISGVDDREVPRGEMRDKHRVLVGKNDRLGNVQQIRSLRDGGYDGLYSFEPFAERIHRATNPIQSLRESMEMIVQATHP